MRMLQTLRRRMNGEGRLHDRRGDDLDHDLRRRRVRGRSGDDVRVEHHWPVASEAVLARGRRPADGRGPRAQLRQPRPVGHQAARALGGHDEPRPLGGRERPDLRSRRDRAAWRPSRSFASPARRRRCSITRTRCSNGATTYEVYRYVTWVDSPQDGTGAATPRTGTTTASATPTARTRSVSPSSSSGTTSSAAANVPQRIVSLLRRPDRVHGSGDERRARRWVPDRERGDKTVTFTANASDSDGTIASVSWNFGDSATETARR